MPKRSTNAGHLSSDSDSGSEDRPSPKKLKNDSDGQKDDDGNTYFDLDRTKRVTVSQFKGKVYVNIREYFEKDGKMLPGKKGISLQPLLWRKLLDFADDINAELKSK